MPFTKIFGTTAGAYSDHTLWRVVSLRNPALKWTASGSGTSEYYVTTTADGDPGFVATPPTTNGVFLNGSAATKATAGSLTAGQWAFADNDTLGFSTVYVRLTDSTDPDTKDVNYVEFKQIPQTGEHVRWAPDSASIDSETGIDQGSVAIGDFIVEEGCEATFGSEDIGYLRIDPNRFEFRGNGESWIDLTTAAIAADVYSTGETDAGGRGLYLKGTAISVLNIMGGSVGLAARAGETSTATTVRVQGGAAQGGGGFGFGGGGGAGGASLWLGNGVTLTNLHVYGGEVRVRSGVTTTILYDGLIRTEENGAMTTVTQHGGSYIWQSSGNITTYNWRGGIFDMLQSGQARTVSTLNLYRAIGQILYNKEAVTVTSEVKNDTFTVAIGA